MILSRSKPAGDGLSGLDPRPDRKSLPELEDFLLKRDYVGALTLLEFKSQEGMTDVWSQLWTAFCHFHLGDYRKSLDTYTAIQETYKPEEGAVGAEAGSGFVEDLDLNIAVCYFYLGMYSESQKSADKSKDCHLKTRLLFHLAHKRGDEEVLMQQHQRLRDVPEDQLCLASVHYLRGHYQEAIDVYKKLLVDKRNYLALNVYVALCYYKLDYYDVSQEVLGVYLNQHPESTVAVNLKACNLFRLYNGKAAETELKAISSEQHGFGQDLVRHNLVVFRNGEGALKVLPQLVDVVPEARLNLAGWRLRARQPRQAAALLDPVTPTAPLHYILRGVVAVALYNDTLDEEQTKTAQECFDTVGSSASECDTIPGRQCMACSYFLRRQHEEVLVYLNSIKSFFSGDDTFNYNYAQAKVATGLYKEAEECLLQIQDESIRTSYTYLACLCRCYIMNKKGQQAWEICTKTAGSPDSFALLQLVANDSYSMGLFIVAARAFHMLDRLEPNPEAWEGLRGAVAGVVQGAAAAGARGSAVAADVREAAALLKAARHSQADAILRVVGRWAHEHRLPV